MYADPDSITRDIAGILRPPRRVSVSDAAAASLRIETPGGYSGMWDALATPYMVEPMDLLKSRRHEAVVFCAPARTGKTMGLLDGWLTHITTADPGDAGFYFSTQTLAYDYRKRRVQRMLRNCPDIAAQISPRKHDTTIEMIVFRNGMILNLGWPSSSQFAQRDLRYVALSDYDSFPEDIDGEGEPFGLARKRIQVAMSAGMALIESSPKYPITVKDWTPDGLHMAPPVEGGILKIYNRGDRRRWYWRCIHGCGERFEAPALPSYDEAADIEVAASSAYVACPKCGQVYRPHHKRALNLSGTWLAEDGRISTIASFWLLGCAAAYQPWESLVRNYEQAKREEEASGDETALQATTNTDQGMPYAPKRLSETFGAQIIESRMEGWKRFQVPEGVRCLIAVADVQSNRFEVAVVGYGLDRERWLVDRYAIKTWKDGEDEIRLQPPVYREHWRVLTDRLVNATYPLDDGRELRIYRVGVDLGGQMDRKRGADSVSRAYDWWRSLRQQGLAHRARLIRGDSRPTARIIEERFPDSAHRSDRRARSRGDVPVIFTAADKLKDIVASDLQRDVEGPGYVHLPAWLSPKHRAELTAEQRTANGWELIGGRRNETWDLLVMADALALWLSLDRIQPGREPAWFKVATEANSEAITREQRKALKEPKTQARPARARRPPPASRLIR